MLRNLLKLGLCLLLAGFSAGALAQVRAWLDRDSIRAGDTVILTIEDNTSLGTAPDFSALSRDFQIVGNEAGNRFSAGGNGMQLLSVNKLVLRPRRSGQLVVPALSMGSANTPTLNLFVAASGADLPSTPAVTGTVFVEVVPDDNDPYVQQAVGWLVRLYAAVPIVSGKLDQPVPDGASLTKVGDDASYERDIDGRTYAVVERRYLLVPERSGPMTVPPAVFDGRSAPGLFDQLTGGGGADQHARSKPRVLNVRAAPANAPQPWLPLRSLSLRYRDTPQQLRMGAAASVTVEANVDGAGLSQLPDLQLPPIDGVQVFADPVQADEGFTGGRPRVKLTRKFSLVPSREGAVSLDGLKLDWWDVTAGAARSASLPPLNWTVLPPIGGAAAAAANPGTAAAAAAAAAATNDVSTAADAGAATDATGRSGFAGNLWAIAAVLFALLWLATLLWALHLRGQPQRVSVNAPASPAPGAPPASLSLNLPALRQLIDMGDFDHIASVLRGLGRPPAADDDELIERLADPDQREAVQALRRARWGGGDGVAARNLLRAAFARPPQWRQAQAVQASPLAPLYPERK